MTQHATKEREPSTGTGTCPQCRQTSPIKDWCIVADHTYVVDGQPVRCPGSGAIQHMVSRALPVAKGDEQPKPTKRQCNSCGGSGQVKAGRDKNDNIIWIQCSSCKGAGEI